MPQRTKCYITYYNSNFIQIKDYITFYATMELIETSCKYFAKMKDPEWEKEGSNLVYKPTKKEIDKHFENQYWEQWKQVDIEFAKKHFYV